MPPSPFPRPRPSQIIQANKNRTATTRGRVCVVGFCVMGQGLWVLCYEAGFYVWGAGMPWPWGWYYLLANRLGGSRRRLGEPG